MFENIRQKLEIDPVNNFVVIEKRLSNSCTEI